MKDLRPSHLLTRFSGFILVGLMALWLGFLFHSTAVEDAAAQTYILSVVQSSDSVNEGSSVNIDVQINTLPSAGVTVTIQYATSGGTAVAGTDYTPVSGILTFTSTSLTQQRVTIQTIRNSATLNDRTVNFTISNAKPASSAGTDPAKSSAPIFIVNIDSAPTATPTGGLPIFADAYEPNNSFDEASATAADAPKLCSLTFYPPGDQDYFRWWGKAGVSYLIATSDLDPAIDTVLEVYDTNQNLIFYNDDVSPGDFRSEAPITANVDGYYFARVTNKSPGDPVDKTYCFQVTQFISPTPTMPPAFPTGADACEYNSTIEFACLFIVGETKQLTFVSTLGSEQDTDYFRMWIKPGIYYTCDTEIPSGSAADTNMVMLDANGNSFNPQIGNDDKEVGDLGSQVSYLSTYTGWLHMIVNPVNVPPLEEAPQHTYTLTCVQTVATPTPTPTETPTPTPTPILPTSSSPIGGGSGATTTPIPTIVIPTFPPSPTPINPADFIPTPVPPPLVNIQPLATATSVSGGRQTVTIDVTVYYDSNNNFLPELTEGIIDTAVALFDNGTGELLSFGQTNEAGMIHFAAVEASGTVRVVVPYFNLTQIVTQSSDELLIRVAPGTLPIGIP
ncbi:MAG: hypothetical protein GY796_14655 [Chloroflexi bacterium]|nr:hypothetical protein [Chloroflexota bacterium]